MLKLQRQSNTFFLFQSSHKNLRFWVEWWMYLTNNNTSFYVIHIYCADKRQMRWINMYRYYEYFWYSTTHKFLTRKTYRISHRTFVWSWAVRSFLCKCAVHSACTKVCTFSTLCGRTTRYISSQWCKIPKHCNFE